MSVNKTYASTKLTVLCECCQGHSTKWESSADLQRRSEINLWSAAAILFTGTTHAEISRYFSAMQIPFLSESTYYRIQRKYLIPTVDEYFAEKQQEVMQLIKDLAAKKPLTIMGDGR